MMSRVHMENLTCTHCKKESPYRFWDMIDPMMNRETKEKVLNGEIFTFVCPHCGAKRRVTYDTIYQEMAKGRTFHLVTSEETYMQAINIYADRDAHSSPVLAHEVVRIVLSQNQLAEKIRIFDEGLDDRIIEIIKAYFLGKLYEQDPKAEVDEVLFYVGNDGAYEVAFLSQDGNHRSIAFSKEMYDGIQKDIGNKLPPINQELEVDMEIAMEYLKQ
ncbi:MAG: CpXC domain-containing protein [Lachnospiraceae bacterium]|nr:CpXC domain-containing protein [Lachnospiraceae bacterium]